MMVEEVVIDVIDSEVAQARRNASARLWSAAQVGVDC